MASIDSLFSSLSISASGLTAQRKRMDLIANNLANASTTRTEEGGPYKRQDLVFVEKIDSTGKEAGVEIKEVFVDPTAPRMIYDPSHPDANKQGYVLYPNVSVIQEMTNMMHVMRAYEANVTVMTATKDMINKSFEIVKG